MTLSTERVTAVPVSKEQKEAIQLRANIILSTYLETIELPETQQRIKNELKAYTDKWKEIMEKQVKETTVQLTDLTMNQHQEQMTQLFKTITDKIAELQEKPWDVELDIVNDQFFTPLYDYLDEYRAMYKKVAFSMLALEEIKATIYKETKELEDKQTLSIKYLFQLKQEEVFLSLVIEKIQHQLQTEHRSAIRSFMEHTLPFLRHQERECVYVSSILSKNLYAYKVAKQKNEEIIEKIKQTRHDAAYELIDSVITVLDFYDEKLFFHREHLAIRKTLFSLGTSQKDIEKAFKDTLTFLKYSSLTSEYTIPGLKSIVNEFSATLNNIDQRDNSDEKKWEERYDELKDVNDYLIGKDIIKESQLSEDDKKEIKEKAELKINELQHNPNAQKRFMKAIQSLRKLGEESQALNKEIFHNLKHQLKERNQLKSVFDHIKDTVSVMPTFFEQLDKDVNHMDIFQLLDTHMRSFHEKATYIKEQINKLNDYTTKINQQNEDISAVLTQLVFQMKMIRKQELLIQTITDNIKHNGYKIFSDIETDKLYVMERNMSELISILSMSLYSCDTRLKEDRQLEYSVNQIMIPKLLTVLSKSTLTLLKLTQKQINSTKDSLPVKQELMKRGTSVEILCSFLENNIHGLCSLDENELDTQIKIEKTIKDFEELVKKK